MNSATKNTLLLSCGLAFVSATVMGVLMYFENSSRPKKFEKRIWGSSFSRGWYPAENCYTYDLRYSNVGIVIVPSGMADLDKQILRRLIADAIAHMRQEYGSAFAARKINANIGKAGRAALKVVEFEKIHVIVLGSTGVKAENAESYGIIVAANRAFDSIVPPWKVIDERAIISNCYWLEIKMVNKGGTTAIEHFPILENAAKDEINDEKR